MVLILSPVYMCLGCFYVYCCDFVLCFCLLLRLMRNSLYIMYTLTIFRSGSAVVSTKVLYGSQLVTVTGYIRSKKSTPQKLLVDVDL